MDRLRICELITELKPAGAERCVLELARRLDKAHFDVQVAALRGGSVADQLRQAGIPVHVMDMRGKWDLWKIRRLAGLLRSQKIDLLHTHLFHADFAGRIAAGLAGTPHLVHTVHVAEARFRPWQFAFARLADRRCDRIVAVSEAVRDWHAERSHLPLNRYTVIYNGIDSEAYRRDDAKRQLLRARWGIGEADICLVFVGRLDRQKGLDVLLAAMERLARGGSRVKLVIAGDGPQRAEVERFVARTGGLVRWLGFEQDVQGVLSAGDIFVLPSRWEGFGLAAAEAMAAGLPVIGTDVPGLREVLDAGKAGVMIRPEDVGAIVEAVGKLISDAELRRRLGEMGSRRVAEHFSLSANIEAHEKLYAEIAKQHG